MNDMETTAKHDSILEELWAIRAAHTEQFNGDLRAIFENYQRLAEEVKKAGHVFETLPPQKVER